MDPGPTPAAVAALDAACLAAVRRVVEEESARRRHVVVSLAGDHARGVASGESDVIVRAIHVAPTERLVGLSPPPPAVADRLELVAGVELDYASTELQPALAGLLAGDGELAERVLSRFALRSEPDHEALRDLARRSLSRRLHRHYRGLAAGRLREWERHGFRSARRLLEILAAALTGTHALLSGQLETDVTLLLDAYGFAEVRAPLEARRRAAAAELAPDAVERWRREAGRALDLLDSARARSPLPEEPRNADEVEAWLVAVRRDGFG